MSEVIKAMIDVGNGYIEPEEPIHYEVDDELDEFELGVEEELNFEQPLQEPFVILFVEGYEPIPGTELTVYWVVLHIYLNIDGELYPQ